MLKVGAANYVYVKGLQDVLTGTYPSDAAITCTITSVASGVEITGSPVTLSYQSGTDGDYYGTLPGTADLTAGESYNLKFKASNYDYQETIQDQTRTA